MKNSDFFALENFSKSIINRNAKITKSDSAAIIRVSECENIYWIWLEREMPFLPIQSLRVRHHTATGRVGSTEMTHQQLEIMKL